MEIKALIFAFVFGATLSPFIILIFGYIGWRRFIWKLNSKGVYRIVKEGDDYYPEKRFLWLFFVRMGELGHSYCISRSSKEDARYYIKKFIHELDYNQSKVEEVIDFSKCK